MECNDDTGAMILLRIKSNIVFSYTLHHAESGNGALRCTGGATGPEPGRAGRKTIILVGSFGADRLQHPRPAHICQTGRIVVVPGLPLPMSLASRSEFIHVISGQMQYFVNGAIVTLEAGNGLVVNSSRLHYGFSPQQRQCWFTCVVVGPELLERLGADERVFVGELLHQRVPTAARRHSAHLA